MLRSGKCGGQPRKKRELSLGASEGPQRGDGTPRLPAPKRPTLKSPSLGLRIKARAVNRSAGGCQFSAGDRAAQQASGMKPAHDSVGYAAPQAHAAKRRMLQGRQQSACSARVHYVYRGQVSALRMLVYSLAGDPCTVMAQRDELADTWQAVRSTMPPRNPLTIALAHHRMHA